VVQKEGQGKEEWRVGVVEGKAHQCQCGPDAGRDVINSSIHISHC
jgi:hypothetical protein